MAEQGIPDNQEVSFGDTEPPRLFDEEPTIIIFDRNDYIADPHIDLKPFENIASIIKEENTLQNRLTNNDQSFTVASILPQWNHPRVQTFVQYNLLMFRRVSFIYLFYIDIELNNMEILCGNQLLGCSPITSRISAETREICARTNDLNMTYCEQHRALNDAQGDISSANAYAIQRQNRLDLQLAYIRQLEEQLVG